VKVGIAEEMYGLGDRRSGGGADAEVGGAD